jgi:hypothetical protein
MSRNQKIKSLKILGVVMATLSIIILSSYNVLAQSSSTNYRIEESYFGTGGELDASSTNYRARQSTGELGVGATGSTNYRAQAGFNTTDIPYLEMSVTGGSLDLGALSASTTATGTATFTVRSYLSSGYIVAMVGTPPTNEGNSTITPMASTAASSTGTEQFGVNLRANTSPATFGADPVQAPDASFSFGQVSTNYNTVNQYRYVVGETIAYSNSSSGSTTYTVAYIVNIAPLTEAGKYVTDQIFVATATF